MLFLCVKALPFPFYLNNIIALLFSYTKSNCNSTFKLDENAILKDIFDLIADNKHSDRTFEDKKVENKELLYPVAPDMVFIYWKKLDEYVVTKSNMILLLSYY